jgi:hypothetical protein
MNREELAWAAGFFDGEGYVGGEQQEGRSVRLVIQVAQADPRPLERLCAALGGNVHGPYERGNRPYWVLVIGTFEQAQNAVALLWGWLSEPKRDQVRRAMAQVRAGPRGRSMRCPHHTRAARSCRACRQEVSRRYKQTHHAVYRDGRRVYVPNMEN